MFEPIIQYFVDKGELHERAVQDIRAFISYLENQTEYTKARLQDVVKSFNYETVQPNRVDGAYCFPHLEFWRGTDDYESRVGFNYSGNMEVVDNLEPITKSQYERKIQLSNEERIAANKVRASVKIDLQKYPVSSLGYYEYRFNDAALFHAWLAYLWQEVEGHQCGLKVKTVQNNSLATFSLNDFLEDDFSAFMEPHYGNKPPQVDRFFPRKLTIIELFLRANQTGYPFNPYQNYWRYFEKGDEFTEIVTYECATGIRYGKLSERPTAEVKQMKQYENPKSALMYLTDFTNQVIFNGWEEKLRPLSLPEMVHSAAYDFDFWTGVAWFRGDEQKNRLKTEDLLKFEENHDIKLPDAFFQYLRLFNGRQYNDYHLYFPIDDLYNVRVQKFYTLEELNSLALLTLPKNPDFLWIGLLDLGEDLGICVQKQSHDYGKIAIDKEGDIQICDYSFEKFARYAQSSSVQPEIFAAQENDVFFLKKRLEEGWDFTTEYRYEDAIRAAAKYNAHEVLELLLQHGARLKNKNYTNRTWPYDEKTMDLLDKYL